MSRRPIAKIRAAVTNASLVAAPGDAATASGVATIIKVAGGIDAVRWVESAHVPHL
jgi:hypothetical protein